MRCLPSADDSTSQLGIRQVEREYRKRYANRLQRARISGRALLLAGATHALLTAPIIATIIERGSVLPVQLLSPYLDATVCVLPFTYSLGLLYAHSRVGARQARTQLMELECLLRKIQRSSADEC